MTEEQRHSESPGRGLSSTDNSNHSLPLTLRFFFLTRSSLRIQPIQPRDRTALPFPSSPPPSLPRSILLGWEQSSTSYLDSRTPLFGPVGSEIFIWSEIPSVVGKIQFPGSKRRWERLCWCSSALLSRLCFAELHLNESQAYGLHFS